MTLADELADLLVHEPGMAADAVERSDWLRRVRLEAQAEALEEAAGKMHTADKPPADLGWLRQAMWARSDQARHYQRVKDWLLAHAARIRDTV